jgi:hypothetical protein
VHQRRCRLRWRSGIGQMPYLWSRHPIPPQLYRLKGCPGVERRQIAHARRRRGPFGDFRGARSLLPYRFRASRRNMTATYTQPSGSRSICRTRSTRSIRHHNGCPGPPHGNADSRECVHRLREPDPQHIRPSHSKGGDSC